MIYNFDFFKLSGRLRNKIFFMTVFVSVGPLIILGFLAFYSLNLFHRFDIAGIEDNLINQKTEEVSGFINNIIGVFELRVDYELSSPIASSSQNFILNELLKSNPALEEAAFVNTISEEINGERIAVGKETAKYSKTYPNGASDDVFINKSKLESFQQAATGKIYSGPVYYTLKGPMISIASPVLNANNAVINVLTGEINLSGVQKIIQNSRLGNSGYLYLLDYDGFLIAHSQASKAIKTSFKSQFFASDLLKGEKKLGIGGQARYQSVWGEPVVGAGDYISKFGWAIIAEWPANDADLIVSTVRNQIILFSLIVFIAAVFASVFLADRIVKPIKILESGTKRVSQGKFDQLVEIKTGDEIEDLGEAFNKMTAGLKRLEELKEEFVFIAAHELRTPVSAIKGYLSMVLDGTVGPVSQGARKFIEEVLVANQRLIQLVNDLLQVARSDAGRLTIDVVSLDIREQVKTVVSELTPLSNEKNIKIIYQSADVPGVMADSVRLKEVLVNLIGNAIKYTIGSGEIAISHEVKAQNLITHIKDSGIGISTEAQKKLFEKFYRVQTEKTRDITGTGLGLFIVKQIIEKMNGKIWVESEEGKGSTFSFSLPIAIS
ncbi:MAG: sensor histidine kinase [Candidatus Brennerbacteria bacterium]|nr:sensor histidine kinase [Candidatus Brennerbacteria bacterium]